MSAANSLRGAHPKFTFLTATRSVKANNLELTFTYQLASNKTFTHKVVLDNIPKERLQKIPTSLLDRLTVAIGMVTALSYWKTTASPQFVVDAAWLDPAECAWWETLLLEGMGEYFFVNDLDHTVPDFVRITTSVPAPPTPNTSSDTLFESELPPLLGEFLVPLGGGKDSVVALELLKAVTLEKNQENTLGSLILETVTTNSHQKKQSTPAHTIATLAKTDQTVVVTQYFDPLLLELNAEDYLNGHTPFSALLAFISILAATMHGYKAVVLANEDSANEGNVTFHGREINHQYSKTLAFETAFRQYCDQFLFKPYSQKNRPEYFSLLRPLFELQIAELFATLPQYHSVFRSCNKGKSSNSWCGSCSKCLFAYLILFPYFPLGELEKHFGKDLFADESLLETAKELLGVGEKKPLDCVGTYEETTVACFLSVGLYHTNKTPLPPLLSWIDQHVLSKEKNLPSRASALSNHWNHNHHLPAELVRAVQKKLYDPLRRLKNKRFIIFGVGREGSSTYAFLRKHFPTQELITADEKPDNQDTKLPATLKADSTTVVFKSPGIPSTHPVVARWLQTGARLSSNTELFFELLKTLPQPATTIGVTGTKGKSTTAAVIARVLEQANTPVLLGGNIGTPPLELWQEITKHLHTHNTAPVVVLELSAHQLAELHHSPNIAVVQNITPEHLDYYRSFEEYVAAKARLVQYQSPADAVVFNCSLEMPTAVAQKSDAQPLCFSLEKTEDSLCYEANGVLQYKNEPVIDTSQLSLVGSHNLLNVMPAVVIGKKLGLTTSTIAEALKSFKPLPHRLEKVTEKQTVVFYNDSLATTPEATIEAVKNFSDRPVVLIAGGADRNLDFSKLAEFLAQSSVVTTVLFPPTGEKIGALLETTAPQIAVTHATTMQAAVQKAYSSALSVLSTQATTANPPVVLLSPGSASFGLFKDYADRGEQFKNNALKLE